MKIRQVPTVVISARGRLQRLSLFDHSDDIKFTYGNKITHVVPYYNDRTIITEVVNDSQSSPPYMTKVKTMTPRVTINGSVTSNMGYDVIYPYSSGYTDDGSSNFDVWMSGFSNLSYLMWPTANWVWNTDLANYDYGVGAVSSDVETDQGTDEQLLSDIDYKDGNVHYCIFR